MLPILFLLALPAIGATHCVGTVDAGISCGTMYTKTGAHVQDAMDAAACGDTIYLEPGGSHYTAVSFSMRRNCTSPITITSGKPTWLPCSTCRVTPAYLPVMPVISGTSNNGTLVGIRDGDQTIGNNPPRGWNWVGVAFTSEVVGSDVGLTTQYYTIHTGGGGMKHQFGGAPYYIQNASDAPRDITFDRCLFFHRFTDLGGSVDDNYNATTLIYANGRDIVFKNSFMWPFYGQRVENHGFGVQTGPGPLTLSNNFISAAGIPIFTGGSNSDYVGGGAGSMVTEYNFVYKPWKWYATGWKSGGIGDGGYGGSCTPGAGDPACEATVHPYPNDYLTNLSRHGGTYKWGCMKNLMEHKVIDGSTVRYNVFDFQPLDGGGNCGSQANGMTLTPRAAAYQNPVGGGATSGPSGWMDSTFTGPGVGSLASSGTEFSWKSKCGDTGPVCGTTDDAHPLSEWLTAGMGVCSGFNPKTVDSGFGLGIFAFDCHKITSVAVDATGATDSTGVLAGAFSPSLGHPSTTLTADISDTDLTIPVSDTTGFSTEWSLKIGSERIWICSKTSNTFTACPRAASQFDQTPTQQTTRGTGTINVAGTAVTRVSGTSFDASFALSGNRILINNAAYYTVASVTDGDHLTLSTSAGTQTAVPFTAQLVNGGRGANLYSATSTPAAHTSGTEVSVARVWLHNYDDAAVWRNVTITSNVFRNVATGFTVLLKDRNGWSPEAPADAGRIKNLNFSHNLFQDTFDGMKKAAGIKLNSGEGLTKHQGTTGGDRVTIEHNTFDWTRMGDNFYGVFFGSDGFPQSLVPIASSFFLRGNIFPETTHFGSNLGMNSSYGSSFGSLSGLTDSDSTSYTHNVSPGSNLSLCAPVSCTGVLVGSYASKVSYLGNTNKMNPSATAAKAAHDGADMGANYDALPLIRNLQTRVSDRTALLEFDLAAPIADAGNTQPCMLDVSTSEEVRSYIGLAGQHWTVPYTNINALRPDYFKGANQSNTTNPALLAPVVANGHVSWPIGQDDPGVDDDNLDTRDLRLSPSTQYWGRLMCYGDTQHFTFTTAAANSGATSIPLQFSPTSGTTTVDVEYGATAALGSTASGSVSAGKATVSVPVTAGTPIYTRYNYSGGTAYTSAKKIILP